MVAVVFAETGVEVMVNLPVLVPAGTTTLAGTCADVELLAMATVEPPAGEGPVRNTVPDVDLPLTTELGFRMTLESVGAFTVKVAVNVPVPAEAVIVTSVFAATADVVMLKVALRPPAATVTVEGTWATAVLEEVSVTVSPAAGATAEMVTRAPAGEPPTTEVVASASAETFCA